MIERTYLQWVGTSHFATVDEFLAEVRTKGVCKKLPNRNVAVECAKPGTLIFLAHDRGQLKECLECAELVTCPTCGGEGEINGSRCLRCKALGALERGTGGHALVDGETWTYVRLMQLKKNRWHEFWKSPHSIQNVHHCPACGGRGRIPLGVVFGFYMPQSVVYVAKPGEDGELLDRLAHNGVRVTYKRVLSRRVEPGGYYATTAPSPSCPPAGMVQEIEKLVGPGVLYASGFGLLTVPIPYQGKHFRGIKKWEAPVYVPEPEAPGLLEGLV